MEEFVNTGSPKGKSYTWNPVTSCIEEVLPLEGMKHDNEKNMLQLISVPALWGLGQVLTHGARKYGDRNWEKGLLYSRCFGALLRHLFLWWRGEDIDQDSGLHHLDHAVCELMFLSHYTKDKTRYESFDDRPTDHT